MVIKIRFGGGSNHGKSSLSSAAHKLFDHASHASNKHTSRLEPDKQLTPGQALTSDNGMYRFVFQEDSNLVLYKLRQSRDAWDVLWASDTWDPNGSSHGKYVVLQLDGNFVMYDKHGQPLWSSGSWQYGAQKPYVVVQDDGNVCLYDERLQGCFWSTDTWQGVNVRPQAYEARNVNTWQGSNAKPQAREGAKKSSGSSAYGKLAKKVLGGHGGSHGKAREHEEVGEEHEGGEHAKEEREEEEEVEHESSESDSSDAEEQQEEEEAEEEAQSADEGGDEE